MTVYIYSEEDQVFVEKNKALDLWPPDIGYIPFSKLDTIDPEKISHLLVTGFIKEIKHVMRFAYKHDISLGIVPTPKQKELKRTLELPSKIEDAITLALTPAQKKLDLLFCF